MTNRNAFLHRGLPDWLMDTKFLVVVFLLGIAGVNVARNLLKTPPAQQAKDCAPFPHGPYQPGVTSVTYWSGRVREEFNKNYESKKMETGYVLDAISRCPLENCSKAMADKYYSAITSYGWVHVILARDADIASGTEGVRYINTLFQTPDDQRIIADLRKRIAAKWFDPSLLANEASIKLMAERDPKDFAICPSMQPNYDLVPGTFRSATEKLGVR